MCGFTWIINFIYKDQSIRAICDQDNSEIDEMRDSIGNSHKYSNE